MPTFGDYETVGEPVATRDERGHVSTIWQARKSRESGGRLYAIKCYAPRRRQPGEGSSGEALDEDLGLEFLEGIKQLKKAHSEGGSCLASIHAFGIAATGAWYVTDFYPRNTLKAWVARHGSVDSAAVRHVVYSVVTGCLVLKRSRGYSHGNLKSGNVFLVGKPRPLRKTPLHLGDPYPAAPLQLSRLDADDRHSPGELLQKVTEARDLRAIGELILELVEGRLVQSGYDYNYPVAPSPAWDRLGRDGERWRQLCNRLLDPQLSSAQVNLESLAKEFRPNPVIAKLPVILSVLGVICAVGGGVYLASHLIKQSSKQRQETREAKRRATLEIFDSSITNANKLLEDSNYSLAAVEFQKAVKLAGELNDTDKKKAAEQGQGHASMLAQAKAAGLVEDEIKALEEALKFKQDAKVEAWLADARRRKEQGDQERTLAQKRSELDKAMADGERLLGQTNYAQAAVEFQKAVKLAGELNDTDKKKAADEGERFAVAVSQAKAAGWAEDEIKSFEEALKVRKDAKVEAWLADAKRRKEQSEQQRTLAQKRIELDKAIVDGNRLLGQTNYAQAAVEFQKAVKLAGELNDTDKKKAAEQGQGYANALAQAKAAGRIEDEIKALEEALKFKTEAKVEAWLADAKRRKEQGEQNRTLAQKRSELDQAIADGNRLLGQTNYAQATVEFQKAVKLARELNDTDKKKAADQGQGYASALAQAKAAGRIEDEIKSLEEALRVNKDAKVEAWLVEAKDFQTADKAFTVARYDDALKVCDRRRGIDRFEQLAQKVRPEKDQLNAVTVALNAGQYDAVLQAKNLPAKQPFTEVIEAGRQEQGQLIALRESQKLTNRPAVLAGLEKLKQQVRDKTPFAELSQWARQQQPVTPPAANKGDSVKQADVTRADAQLDLLEVWLGIDKKNSKGISEPGTTARAKQLPKSAVVSGLLPRIDVIQQVYQSTGALSQQRQQRIEQLRKAINNW